VTGAGLGTRAFWPGEAGPAPVVIVHDHIVQLGGSERVLLAMADALGSPPVVTSFHDPELTHAGFSDVGVRTSRLNRWPALRQHHRLAFPLMAPLFSSLTVDADVTVCSSIGWAHGVRATGAKLAYLFAPPRWLYQTGAYLSSSLRRARLPVAAMAPALRRWDRRAVGTIDRALTSSRAIRGRLRALYGLDAEVVPPPTTLGRSPLDPVAGLPDGFLLCVARLLAYKRVDVAIAAAARVGLPLVVVGRGPERAALEALGGPTVFVEDPSDAQLRWLYEQALALVAVADEDFGLSPIEANALGTPVVALAAGGYLDTVVDGETGMYAEQPTAPVVAAALREVLEHRWDLARLHANAARYRTDAFATALRGHVDDLAGRPVTSPAT
jgi:glycosyltransferase involved in cell wall biosynthesis